MAKAVKYPKGIRPRANGVWGVAVCVKGQRKTGTAASLEEAIKLREALIHSLSTGAEAPVGGAGGSWTLGTAYQRTYEMRWKGTKSEETAVINSSLALRFFGRDCQVQDITTERIDDWVEWLLQRGIQYSTVNRKLNTLSRILRTAVERGKLASVPVMPRRAEKSYRIRFLSVEEETELLSWMKQLDRENHMEATIVLLDTGMRCSELWKLTAADVSLTVSGVGVVTAWNPKNGQPRSVPLTTRVKRILTKRMEEHPTGKLFPGSNNDWYRLVWNRVRGLMNMEADPNFVPHILRHTCASRLAQRGFPISHIKEWMGHLAIQTTMRYITLAPKSLFSGVALLESGDHARWSEHPAATFEHTTGLAKSAKPVQ